MEKMKNICNFIAYSKFKKYQSKKQEPNVKEKKIEAADQKFGRVSAKFKEERKEEEKKMVTGVKPMTHLGHTSPYSIEGTNIFQTSSLKVAFSGRKALHALSTCADRSCLIILNIDKLQSYPRITFKSTIKPM